QKRPWVQAAPTPQPSAPRERVAGATLFATCLRRRASLVSMGTMYSPTRSSGHIVYHVDLRVSAGCVRLLAASVHYVHMNENQPRASTGDEPVTKTSRSQRPEPLASRGE